MDRPLNRDDLKRLTFEYYEACNAGDARRIESCFTTGAIHYSPAGASQRTFTDAAAIAAGWVDVVQRLDSRWTIDHLVVDVDNCEVAIEWTHWKPAAGGHLRGIEICTFSSDGLIDEIRAAYAAPATAAVHEYGDFPYEARGYAVDPPNVVGRPAPRRMTWIGGEERPDDR
jgi:hypothetical protein